MWRSIASDAMGISARGLLPRCVDWLFGKRRWGGGLGRPIATRITGVAERRLIDDAAVQVGARASMVVASREPAKRKCSTGMSPRTGSDHDVSILITAAGAAGR